MLPFFIGKNIFKYIEQKNKEFCYDKEGDERRIMQWGISKSYEI